MATKETILFFKERVSFRLNNQSELKRWLASSARKSDYKIQALNFIFCSDDYLLEINKKYLEHDYYTDIITFDNSIEKSRIEGDVYISIDTVRKNSLFFKTSFPNELHRVMIHGLLHLMGYKDKTEKDRKRMKEIEDLHLISLAKRL